MATNAVTDTYLKQIHTARNRIHECFKHAHEILALRETNLISELNSIQNKFEKDSTSQQEELQDLEKSKQSLKSLLHDNDTLNETLATLNRKIEQIMILSSKTHSIHFNWNPKLERELENVGEIISSSIPQSNIATSAIPDYKNKSIPVITCCKHRKTYSTDPGELFQPNGLAIEPQSGRIYIADTYNNRIQVFSSNGEYCFMFNDQMNRPWAICINNNAVYISQWFGYVVTVHKLNGEFINLVGRKFSKKAGSKGENEGQFSNPAGIAICRYKWNLYVCDYDNDRIQIFNKNLEFHLMFGKDILQHPNDVNLTREFVFVLDQSDPSIHLFNSSDHLLLKSIASSAKKIGYCRFFTIDKELNIILADIDNHCIIIFNKSGEFISKFGKEGNSVGDFIDPTGVAIDCQNRIVVVSRNKDNALQMF